MDKERFQKLSEIFEAALAIEYSLREEFVSVQCGADAELKKEVARLLLHHEYTEGVLEETQGEVVTTLAPVLEGGPFKTPDRRVRHALSYWQLRQTAREELRSVGPQIRLFELLAGLIPLAGAVLALGATPTASGRDLVTFLIIMGMTEFGLALHAARQINAAIALVTEGGDAKQ